MKTITKTLVAMFTLTLPACSSIPGAYLEIGTAAHQSADCDGREAQYCGLNPLGSIEGGYQFRSGLTFGAMHESSFEARDRGINKLTVRYRFGGGRNYLDKE